jgi:hypothetical protein
VAGNSLTRAVAGLLGLEPSAAQAAKEEKGVAVSNPASLHDPTSARIAALFADELNVPAEVGDTFRVVSADGLDSSLAPVLATATGLALRGAEG